MTGSMPSEQLQLLIAGYVLGDLEPEEAAELEQRLADDPALAEEVSRMQKALELSYALPELQPPAQLRSAILGAQAQSTQPQSRPQLRPVGRAPFAWSRAIGVAAAGLIIALGINNYRLWQALQVSQTAPQRFDVLTYSLQSTAAAKPAAATVVANPNDLGAVLTAQNLPPLPPGKVYVLWTVLQQGAPFTTDHKGAILTEVFKVNPQGKVVRTVTLPEVYRSKDWITKIAITLEDAAAPQRHQGAPILITS